MPAQHQQSSQAHFEFVWPRPRINDGRIFLSEKATQYPCGGQNKASRVRTPFPLSGNVPIQLKLKNWNSPDAPRKVMINVKMNLGNNAGVGQFKTATQERIKDFEFKTGMRFLNEEFYAGGALCLQDIWAPGMPGHGDFARVNQLEEGMNATLHMEVAETGAYGQSEVVRRGYMCADITFTKERFNHHQYVKRCRNDSMIVTNTDNFPLVPISTPKPVVIVPLSQGPPHSPNRPLPQAQSGMSGLLPGWGNFPSADLVKKPNVAAKVGAAIGGSVAAAILFGLLFFLLRRRINRRNASTAFAPSDVETRPTPEQLFAANRIPRANTGIVVAQQSGMRGGEGDVASQDGFEAAERNIKEESAFYGDVKVRVEELEDGSLYGDEKELPTYVEAAGRGRDLGPEKQ